jgi:hypothetical protein
VLESLQAISLLTIMEIVGPVILLAVLIYGTLQWSRRRRGRSPSGEHPRVSAIGKARRLKSGKKHQVWRETTLRINVAEPIILSHDHVAATGELLGQLLPQSCRRWDDPAGGTLSRVTENAERLPSPDVGMRD